MLNLPEERLSHFRRTFDLTYHIPYLETCISRIPVKGLDVLEVGGAMPASLVIGELGCNSWTAVEAPSYDQELGEANQFHRNLADDAQQHLTRYKHLYHNIEDIPEIHFNRYDLIFTIACFEHINRLPMALEVMHQCLKPGGKLFTMHSPIWSAYDGHHLPIGIPERFDKSDPARSFIFRPWGHLLQSRHQTYHDICKRFDRDFAEEIIYYTYNSNHINRYFTEDYASAFKMSSFDIPEIQLTFMNPPDKRTQEALEAIHPSRKHFSNNGILAVLEKQKL